MLLYENGRITVVCDQCQKASRPLQKFSMELDGPIYDESELQPGGPRSKGWVKLDQWEGVAVEFEHEHWCVSCWVDWTDPEPPKKVQVQEVANAFERISMNDEPHITKGWKRVWADNWEHDRWLTRREEFVRPD